jgi:rare lipoprotein A
MINGIQLVIRACCVVCVTAAVCCGGPPKVQYDMARGPDRPMYGVASWYGPGFNGRKTASGERFNKSHYTAAHRSLPFGTVVRVRNLKNGRSVDVRINDRGPFVKGRIIDLSEAAAQQIDLKHRGIGEVELRVLSMPIQ